MDVKWSIYDYVFKMGKVRLLFISFLPRISEVGEGGRLGGRQEKKLSLAKAHMTGACLFSSIFSNVESY